ncbi:hypothetical protein A3C94_01990 [Candidatus Kaiserbacteria bacterium RIFCSPHIGHO2_02_FULL_55_17]|uniref:Uncharacterized protein n=1 Tax=Candidatus Kaiserbacteria bacterium RIFCSPHIGHO2_02_FULL_55_17 TaxID=1798496 RepID=A0A1F6DRW5_9BACT|nr:MAG: hypothetical protein A3C94_01990 [Candidatus Kaiserbacteria bacterium RIFCSPHIGHO2_02_FULL_55_17]
MQTTANNHQNERVTEIIAHAAAVFIAREAGTESLITVIRAESVAHGSPSTKRSLVLGRRATIFVSVFPEEKALAALAFLARRREAFSDYLKQHTHLRLPRVDFLLDNRENSIAP